jgi:cold shock CspA family protein
MSGDYFYGARRKRESPGRPAPRAGPPRFHGTRASGRIAKLLTGQCSGFIRLANTRDVFFHRGDVQEGTAFNDLKVGDVVTFELVEDAVSGARAIDVARRLRA